MTSPASPVDRVAVLRAGALRTINRILASLGTPIILWTAWSLWPGSRTVAVATLVGGAFMVLPAVYPAVSPALSRIAPVAGLLWLAVIAWLRNGASAGTGLLLWGAAIVAAVALGRWVAVGTALGAAVLLLSEVGWRSEWVLPIGPRALEPETAARFVLAFVGVGATILGVTAAVVAPLERSLAAATELLRRLRREQEARTALDDQLNRSDQHARIGTARQLQRHLHKRLTALARSLDEAAGSSEAEREVVERAIANVGETIEHVRAVARQLRPVLLDEAGLGPALEAVVRSQLANAAIEYELDVKVPRHLSPALELACCRIVQEAIDYVLHDAVATRLQLHVRTRADSLEVVAESDGVRLGAGRPGRDADQERSGTGLLGIRQRSAVLGGSVRIDSVAARGTRIEVALPLVVPT